MATDYVIADGTYIHRYMFWNPETWAIPKLYWDAYSQEQRIHAICKQLGKVIAYADYLGTNTDSLSGMVDTLKELFDKFQESGFDDYYASQIETWIDEHLPFIYETTIQQVFFSLDDSGYLLAHIPVGWKQIKFSTPLDYSDMSSYGRLCLTYDFDAELEV